MRTDNSTGFAPMRSGRSRPSLLNNHLYVEWLRAALRMAKPDREAMAGVAGVTVRTIERHIAQIKREQLP